MPQQIGSRPMTNAEKQAAQRERENARGLKRRLVLIPQERSDELDAIIAGWMAQKNQTEQ